MRKYMIGFALLMFAISAFIVSWNTYYLKKATSEAEVAAMTKVWKKIDDATNYLQNFCRNLASESIPVCDDFKGGRLDKTSLPDRLKTILARYEDLGGIRYSLPLQTPSRNELMQDHGIVLHTGVSASDTANMIPFLRIPLPSAATASGPAGELTMEIERWRLKAILLTYDLGAYGFPFIIRTDGTFLWHPHRDFMGPKNNLFAVAEDQKFPEIDQFIASISRHQKICMNVNLHDGKNLWLFGSPVPGFDLVVCGFLNRGELLAKTPQMRANTYRILVFVFICLISAVTVVFLRRADIAEHLWLASGVYTIIFSAGIAAIWALTTLTFPPYIEGGPPLSEVSYLQQQAKVYEKESEKAGSEPPWYIPTGLFIKSIEFDGATNVKVTGNVWQKYPKDGIPGINEGIVFPESVETELEKAYERTEEDQRTIGWNFKVTLREWFDYSTYPFDQQDVWIRMWHVDFDKNVILVPDLIAYSQIDPLTLPGTDEDLILPSWEIKKTFFNFVDYNYNNNFGLKRFVGQTNFPELHFHILISRNFMEPFMSCILPLFVVTLQMFSVLIISTKQETIAERLGFNSGVILQVAAALFFVVIYAQIDLRRRLEAEQIMYMDYFYFTMYFIFITVSANSIMFAHGEGASLIEYRDNLIPKVLFWPLIFAILFLVTVCYFYP